MILYCDNCHATATVECFAFTEAGMKKAALEAGWILNVKTLQVFHCQKCWDQFYHPHSLKTYAIDDQTGEEYEV